jgi:putative flippase GtrA
LLFLQLCTAFWTDCLWTGAKIQLFKDHVKWVYSAVIWIKNGTNWKWLNILTSWYRRHKITWLFIVGQAVAILKTFTYFKQQYLWHI